MCAWATLPTRRWSGLRAYEAVNTQVIRFACELEARSGSLYARARLLGQPARGGSGGRALRSGPRRCRRRECATDCAPNPTERTRSHMRRPTVQLNRGNELRPGAFCMPEAAHLSAATSLPVNGRPVFTRALHQVNWSSPVEWCNRFVSFGLGYALSGSGGSSCPVGWGVSRDLVRMSRLR